MLITVQKCSLLTFFSSKFANLTLNLKKMKKIILAIAVVFAFGIANAQDMKVPGGNGFSKGDKFVEGSFRFTSQDSNSSPSAISDSWALTPKMGVMVDNQWAVGGFLNLSGAKLNNKDKQSVFGIGAFARYYFLALGASKSFNVFGEVGLGYSSVKNNPYLGSSSTNSDINANIDLGINYFFTPHWAATFTLANLLSYNNSNPASGSNSNDLKVEVNLFNNIFAQPQFGLLYKW